MCIQLNCVTSLCFANEEGGIPSAGFGQSSIYWSEYDMTTRPFDIIIYGASGCVICEFSECPPGLLQRQIPNKCFVTRFPEKATLAPSPVSTWLPRLAPTSSGPLLVVTLANLRLSAQNWRYGSPVVLSFGFHGLSHPSILTFCSATLTLLLITFDQCRKSTLPVPS